ncbi:hypothetical protein ACIQWR_01085 [Streptomyces sp. NPDC098789]|uniref:hypothetical protein n=1 Tax=Streptomyces sp. NPDC098789 TaxID=3366098 RepID=UPI00380135BC
MTTQTVTVRFEVQQTATIDVEAVLDVPVDLVHDDEALHAWLADNERLWADGIDADDAHSFDLDVIDVYGTDA